MRDFSFWASFFITLFIGIFLWNVFVIPDVGIFAKFFAANLQSENRIGGIKIEPELLPEIIKPENKPVVEVAPKIASRQDILDDIAEKLDIIQAQVNELIIQNNAENENNEEKAEEEKIEEEKKEKKEKEAEISCVGQIDINTASLEQLKELTGIGDVKAQAIIDARNEKQFISVDDLDRVKGIGSETLQKIKDQNCAYVDPNLEQPIEEPIPLEIKAYTITKVDGGTEIDLEFSKKVKYKISIWTGEVKIKEWTGTAKNPDPKIWDGKSSEGDIFPDGDFSVKIIISDEKDTLTDESKTITIDNSL